MNMRRRSILSIMDDALRWTGMPARVAAQMSGDSSFDREHPPLRWIPIWPIAFSSALFIFCLTWPPMLDGISPATRIGVMVSFMCSAVAMVPGIYMNGPLGKPSLEDDEREAALRKDSYLFCLWLLVVLNGVGQPLLLFMSHWQSWQIAHSVLVAGSTFNLNVTLLACLPTLYASWRLRQLPKE